MEDLYRILGVEPDASYEEITKQFQFLVLSYNPERYPSQEMKEKAAIELRKINDAFLILIDPAQRSRYDHARKSLVSIPAPPKIDNHERSTTDSINPPESSHSREKVFWLVSGMVLFGIFIAIMIFLQNQPAKPVVNSPASTTAPTRRIPTATARKISNTPKPTKRPPTQELLGRWKAMEATRPPNTQPDSPSDCLKWNQITKSLEGKSKCVRGIVKSTYWGDQDTFYMTFSDDTKSFRLVTLGGYYYTDVIGKCVRVTGKIKVWEQVPYITVDKNNFWTYFNISACD